MNDKWDQFQTLKIYSVGGVSLRQGLEQLLWEEGYDPF